MTVHEATADHAHEPESLDLRKLGMWIFLSSEVIFFGSLIIAFLIYKDSVNVFGLEPKNIFDIVTTSIITFILLSSSLTMVLALSAIQRDQLQQGKLWLAATALLGLAFVGMQGVEYNELFHKGMGLSETVLYVKDGVAIEAHDAEHEEGVQTVEADAFGAAFFTLTGFHGTHVFVGVILLLIILGMVHFGKLNANNWLPVELIGLYWHFVDLVWLVLFTLIYLI